LKQEGDDITVKAGTKGVLILLAHALAVWVLCAATMGIGMAHTSGANAVIIHAIAVPIIAFAVSSIYFRKFNYTSPLVTAMVFIVFVTLVDFFLVALLMLKSLEMFKSILGVWIPLVLIFTTTYLNGIYINKVNRTELLNP
jgi:hypothetical protein